MVFLNLHRTSGSTDLVDPVIALDNNWDQIDSKFHSMDSGSSPVGTGAVNPETGMAFSASNLSPNPTIGVWDGVAYDSISTSETWVAWQNITLATNFSAVTGRVPQLRLSNKGRVQCRGAIQYLTGTTVWPTGYNLVNSGQFANASYSPVEIHYKNISAGPITGTASTSWAYGLAHIYSDTSFLLIDIMYLGTVAAGGNYLDLAGINWDVTP